MILIVEGADLVGKSTVTEHFSAVKGYPIIKIRWALRGDPEIETRAMATTTIAILQATQPNAIFDRAYFSWWAYGPPLGYDVTYMPELIARFTGISDARLVVLTATEAELRRRYERTPDHFFSLDVILAANERFPSLLTLAPDSLPRLHIDTTHTPPNEVFAQVEAFIADPS